MMNSDYSSQVNIISRINSNKYCQSCSMELDHKSDFHVTTQLHLGVNCSGHLLNLLDPFLLHHLDRGQDVFLRFRRGKEDLKKH